MKSIFFTNNFRNGQKNGIIISCNSNIVKNCSISLLDFIQFPPFYTYIYFGRVPKFGTRHNASCIYSSRFFFFLKLYITIDRIIAPVPISAIAKGVMSEKSPVFRADKSPPPLFGGKIGLRLPTLKVMV